MHRLFLAALITAFALQADTFTSTICTVGTTVISPCIFMAQASASDNFVGSVSPLPSFAGQGLFADANIMIPGSNTVVVSAQAHAAAFNMFDSVGGSRVGLIEFDVLTSQLHGGDTTVVLTDGANTYSYDAFSCSGSTPPVFQAVENCGWHSILPFDLGTEFTVTVSANVSASVPAGATGTGSDTSAAVLFRLLEANGTTVVPFSVIPEPSTWLLLLLGLGASGRLVWRSPIR